MVQFIIAEKPEIRARDAIKMSKELDINKKKEILEEIANIKRGVL